MLMEQLTIFTERDKLRAENKALREYQKGQDKQLKSLSKINEEQSLNKSVLEAKFEALKESNDELLEAVSQCEIILGKLVIRKAEALKEKESK